MTADDDFLSRAMGGEDVADTVEPRSRLGVL